LRIQKYPDTSGRGLIKEALLWYLLSLYKVKRVFASMNFKKQWSSYYFCLYLGTEAAVSCRLMDGEDRHVLFSFFYIFNAMANAS